ncbi:protein GPR15L isoform X2 [Pipistrellus kuhlii]|uniref:protein GPR15L isoform X2 n=1 Tax=Pipistrellus kuhlii TaxID=59472 RepID=UPI001E2722FD|nr:protein GPR15L isoform X2 [Pipistrellus kuhlii]
MRALVLSGLLCMLLLCNSVFSAEGRRHLRPPVKPWKGKPCCSQVPDPALRTQKGDLGLTWLWPSATCTTRSTRWPRTPR